MRISDWSSDVCSSDLNPDAYERLLMDVVRGNPTLFMRRDEVDAAWGWVDPILAAWRAKGDAPRAYTSGTRGPSASVALIECDGPTWYADRSSEDRPCWKEGVCT